MVRLINNDFIVWSGYNWSNNCFFYFEGVIVIVLFKVIFWIKDFIVIVVFVNGEGVCCGEIVVVLIVKECIDKE